METSPTGVASSIQTPCRPLPWSSASPAAQALLIAAVWLGTSVVSLARYLLSIDADFVSREALALLGTWLLCYSPWALATPVLARAVVRFPLHGPRWKWNTAAVAVIGVPVVWAVVAFGQIAKGVFGAAALSPTVLVVGRGTFFLEYLMYGAAVGVLEGLARGAATRQREQELADLRVQQLELENDLRDAQLEALRMKLNPHFLFNALQTVTALMRSDPEAAERMMTKLGDVLRVALRLDLACEIPLGDEINVARAYLDLERIRFRDRLSVAIDVEEEVRGALVPSLILQPVVENAIRHGVSRVRHHADLRIGVRRTNGSLLISVRDNGVGFRESAEGAIMPGVGLGVLQSRLAKLYPGEADCRLQNRPEGGAEVEIRLPYHTAPLPAGVPS